MSFHPSELPGREGEVKAGASPGLVFCAPGGSAGCSTSKLWGEQVGADRGLLRLKRGDRRFCQADTGQPCGGAESGGPDDGAACSCRGRSRRSTFWIHPCWEGESTLETPVKPATRNLRFKPRAGMVRRAAKQLLTAKERCQMEISKNCLAISGEGYHVG